MPILGSASSAISYDYLHRFVLGSHHHLHRIRPKKHSMSPDPSSWQKVGSGNEAKIIEDMENYCSTRCTVSLTLSLRIKPYCGSVTTAPSIYIRLCSVDRCLRLLTWKLRGGLAPSTSPGHDHSACSVSLPTLTHRKRGERWWNWWTNNCRTGELD